MSETSEFQKGYSLEEIEQIRKEQKVKFDYTLTDAILFLLYADKEPIKGKTKQMKEIFLTLNQVLPKEKIVEIAMVKAKGLGYLVDRMEVHCDEDNKVFSDFLQQKGVSAYDATHDKWEPAKKLAPEEFSPKLKNRQYRAVFLGPQNKMAKGGALWVFIELSTGNVIDFRGGK